MSNETGSPLGATQSSDDSSESHLHMGALVDAVRDAGSSWGFALLMVVFTGIAISSNVYSAVLYPAFFGLCAAGSFAIATGQTYSRYGHYHFERTNDL